MFSFDLVFCEKVGTSNVFSIKRSGTKADVNNIYTKETVSEKCFFCFFFFLCDNLLFFLNLDKDQKGGKDWNLIYYVTDWSGFQNTPD